jgi:putative thioredoxin
MDQLLKTAAAPADADIIKDTDQKSFARDVLEASRKVPVIVDFWAPWCGPCKQLGPMIEKVVRAAKGAVRLVKINIDENQMLAQQMRIQSIPAVYAFFQGRPVDGFMGAVPESQVKQFVDRLVQAGGGQTGGDEIAAALAEAKKAADEGDVALAAQIYSEILQVEPGMPEAVAGVGPTDEFAAKVAANPKDHQARFDLAMALYAKDDRQAAIDHLIESIRLDRKWNDEAARKQLLKFFEAQGFNDPLSVEGRKRLSSILFS